MCLIFIKKIAASSASDTVQSSDCVAPSRVRWGDSACQCLSLLSTARVLWPQWCGPMQAVLEHCSATGIKFTNAHDIIGSRLEYRMSFDPFKCELLHVNKMGKIRVILAYQWARNSFTGQHHQIFWSWEYNLGWTSHAGHCMTKILLSWRREFSRSSSWEFFKNKNQIKIRFFS